MKEINSAKVGLVLFVIGFIGFVVCAVSSINLGRAHEMYQLYDHIGFAFLGIMLLGLSSPVLKLKEIKSEPKYVQHFAISAYTAFFVAFWGAYLMTGVEYLTVIPEGFEKIWGNFFVIPSVIYFLFSLVRFVVCSFCRRYA